MKKKSTIDVEVLDQRHLRNKQCGDWWRDAYGCHHFQVAQTGNHAYNVMILVHELVEEVLCRARGIREEAVTRFDDHFDGNGEPGDDKLAPYRREHRFATKIEKQLCRELGINWEVYADRIDRLCPPR